MYDDLTITQVRFMVRELFSLCESLTIKERTFEETKKEIKRMYSIIEELDHSKWHMEKF